MTMKSSTAKVHRVGGCALTGWALVLLSFGFSIVDPPAMHWRGCLILAASLAVTFSLAWLIVWMMPSAGDSYEAGYHAGERAARQRDSQFDRDLGVVLGGRTGTTSVIPIRPVRR